jgi:hypothetical protein
MASENLVDHGQDWLYGTKKDRLKLMMFSLERII